MKNENEAKKKLLKKLKTIKDFRVHKGKISQISRKIKDNLSNGLCDMLS